MLGAGLLLVAACKHTSTSSQATTVDPDAAVLNQARLAEQQLIAWYDGAIAVTSGNVEVIAAARASHAAHLAALHGGAPAMPIPTPSPAGTIAPSIVSLLTSSTTTLRRAAVNAVDGTNAALLASISAAHQVSSNE